MSVELEAGFELVARLNKDLKQASRLLGQSEVRFLTDFYYQVQKFRIVAAAQVRAGDEHVEPNALLAWTAKTMLTLENDIKRALDHFTDTYAVGQWMKSITGIGPVLSAGFLAHLDVRKAKTAGQFWSFAGLNPLAKWNKGEKRPWNARLKVLCFKLGDCFIKVHNNENDVYGKLYAARYDLEAARNDSGGNAALAAEEIKKCKKKKDGTYTATQKSAANAQGRLHDGHINDRSRRYAVKMFLSHLHHVMYVDYFRVPPPVPFSFEHCEGNHRHFIAPPHFPWTGEGLSLTELYDREPPVKSEPTRESAAVAEE